MSALISPHEIGHSLGGLQDEYDYYQRGVLGGCYTGGEPTSVHHTLLTIDQMLAQQKKWWRWIGEPSEAGGLIGRYEGGMYFDKCVWRPSQHSIMKTLGYYYDQVSREVMTQRISSRVKLVDASTPTTGRSATPTRCGWTRSTRSTTSSTSPGRSTAPSSRTAPTSAP